MNQYHRKTLNPTVTLALTFAASMSVLAMSSFVHADVAATITSTVFNASNATTTSALIGTIVHDAVVVADPAASTTPTGTVDFNLYPSTACSGTAATQTGVALVNGVATSSTTSVPSTGLSYKVHYNGMTNVFSASDGQCEPVTAIKFTPTVSTDILNASDAVITSAIASTTVHDKATVTGSGPTPTGTIDFTFYTDNACGVGGVASGTGISLSSNIATSSSQGPLAVGAYSFRAHYNGDANYASGNSSCEPLSIGTATSSLVTALSSTSVVVGTSVYDTATLSNTVSAGGSVAYKVFTDNACLAGMQSAGSKTVAANVVPNSDSILFNTAGTFYWQAVYSGDVNNAVATSTCTSEVLTVLASTTTSLPGTVSGEVYNDLNGNGSKDSGDSGLSGWTIRISGFHWRFSKHFWWGNWGWHWGGLQTATTDANGNYSFSGLDDGFYFVSEKPQSGWKPTTRPVRFVFIQNGSVVQNADFGNTAASSTPNGRHGDNEGDESKDDHGGNATSTKSDNGNHFGQFKNGNNGSHGKSGKNGGKKDD